MNIKPLLSIALLLSVAPAAWQSAAAGCAMELEVVGTASKTIRIYDAGGKRVGEIDKSHGAPARRRLPKNPLPGG